MSNGKRKAPIVGIDLGGTNMQIGVVSPDNKILGEAKLKTRAADGKDAVVARIVEGVNEACSNAKIKVADLAAVGIGAPGAVDPHQGVVLEAVNLGWKNFNAADTLTKKLGVKTFLDNDVNVAVYGEWRMGAAEGCTDVLGIWCGTGVGGGLILNNQMYYGKFMTAGEIGHTLILPMNSPGNRSLEHNCSRTAVADRIVKLIKAGRKSSIHDICEGDYEKIKSRAIGKAYADGDPLTIEVVDHAAELLGYAAANCVTLLSIERVVMGGGLTEALGRPWVEKIERFCKLIAFPDRCKQARVVVSKLEDRAGVFGAAMIAADRLK